MINGSYYDRFAVMLPGVAGVLYIPLHSEVFWVPSVTRATDDIGVIAQLVQSDAGRLLQWLGGSSLSRTLQLIDYGPPH